MAPANETPAPLSQAEEAEVEALLEKAKKFPPGVFKQLQEEERKMREMAAADPEMARYLESLCRAYLSSGASSAKPDTKWEEEEESKKKEEEKEEEEGQAKVEGGEEKSR
ncbi:uncharacterized protein J4E78_002544 [Alternaria triticimaculans]|uniref:uncharacterized protein n=1 Tax=Alternaria triticimaculans TaxID=297637 RepID=UPI0020C3B7DA|nr:uncharacterized protein J4E78_002544 [Alternaria triticimaculans]KAI4668716.1 hypothetical protein J4E78_002544 [Alternaria triticimaculans]